VVDELREVGFLVFSYADDKAYNGYNARENFLSILKDCMDFTFCVAALRSFIKDIDFQVVYFSNPKI